MNNTLPSNCPMLKANYEHYCISEHKDTLTKDSKCYKHDDCVKIVKNFKEMNVPTTSKVFNKLGGCK